jgi:hypothetical protein
MKKKTDILEETAELLNKFEIIQRREVLQQARGTVAYS